MATKRSGGGRNRGFKFTVQIEEQGKGCKLCILSPQGNLITIPVCPGLFKAIVFLLGVFKADVSNPNIALQHQGRRKIATISRAIHIARNTVSKYAGNITEEILKAARSDKKFAPEASQLPELFCIIGKGPDRGHRLNVDVTIEYLSKPPEGPNASATPPKDPLPSPESGKAPAASSNGCDPQLPEAKVAPSKLVRFSEMPPPLVRPAQIDERSWANGQTVRTNERNRDDSSGQTPA